MFSKEVVAYSSGMLRFVSDVVGGKYTLIIFILVLFGSINLVCNPYSFPWAASIYMGFFM